MSFVRRLRGAPRALADCVPDARGFRVGAGRFTHGGAYLFADPELHLAPSPWLARRLAVEARIERVLGRLPRHVSWAKLDFRSWRALIAGLDVLRTDLAAVCWNEMVLASAGLGASERVEQALRALGWSCATVLSLLPPLREGRQPSPPALAIDAPPRVPAAQDLGRALRGRRASELPATAVRSRRAGDDLFAIWSALALLALEPVRHEKMVAFGNAFGGIDLGCFVAEVLRAGGADCAAAVCYAPRAPAAATRALAGRDWLGAAEGAGRVLFCDDSLTSGRSFAAFRAGLRATGWRGAVDGFFVTFDLLASRHLPPRQATRLFRMARHACQRAPWSPAPAARTRARDSTPLGALRARFAASSDEQLRWIARAQWPAVRRLNGSR
jgi:hypothetical protein